MARRIWLGFTLFCCCARAATAQDASGLTFAGAGVGWVALSVSAVMRLARGRADALVGDTVRFDLASRAASRSRPGHVRGKLVSASYDSIAVADERGATSYARRDLVDMNVLVGQESKWAQGWLGGLLIGGGVIGSLSLLSGGSKHPCDDICLSPSESAAIGLIAGGFTGSLIGAGIGAGMRGERWARASRVDYRPRVGLAPVFGPRVGLQAVISF